MKPKTLIIIGSVAIVVVILIVILCILMNTKKLVCKSSIGNITLNYNEEELTGYYASGKLSFDIEGQSIRVEKFGIEKYLSQFETWFVENTGGSCEYK